MMLTLTLSGCTPIRAVIGMSKPTDHFISSANAPEVRYEPGAEALARHVEAVVHPSIDAVQQRQGLFSRPVVVHVTASVNSFASYCTTPRAVACVLKNRLFIAPRLLQQPQRIAGILTHELSHLQLNQQLGSWKYHTRLPAWFHEGLAVYVADGAGAEQVTPETAIAAILGGQTFTPEDRGSVLFQRSAHHYDLPPQMFYRQASLFVSWLHRHDPIGFEAMLILVEQGAFLYDAMQAAYGFNVEQGWKQFVTSLQI